MSAVLFSTTMLVVFLVGIYAKRRGEMPLLARYAPSLLTSLGILGALCGIAMGLLNFDVDAVPETVGALLSGLKAAFMTSMIGMGLSIIYRSLVTFGVLTSAQSGAADDSQLGISDLYRVMVEQRDSADKQLAIAAEQRQVLSALKKAIAGDHGASLVSQMQRQHKDDEVHRKDLLLAVGQVQGGVEQFQQELGAQLGRCAESVSTGATEQVINALQEIVIDFNLSMTDQFGENFKRFNHAVVQLAEWQDNYKQQMEAMREQYSCGVTAMTKAELSLATITEHARKIPEVMKHLKQVIEVNQHQIGELGRHLDVFNDIRDRAVEAVPILQAQVAETVDGFQQASASLVEGVSAGSDQVRQAMENATTGLVDGSERVNNMLAASSMELSEQNAQMRHTLVALVGELNGSLSTLPGELVEGSRKITEELRLSGKTLLQESEASRRAFDSGLHTMREEMAGALVDMSDQQTAEAKKIFAGLHQQIESALGETGDVVSKQVNMIDEALAQEISVTLTEMGRALTSITGQFTEDYKELVGAMKHVVKAA